MDKREKLLARRAALVDQNRKLLDSVETTLTEEQRKQLEAAKVEIRAITDILKVLDEQETEERALLQPQGKPAETAGRQRVSDPNVLSFGEFLQAVARTSTPGHSPDPRIAEYRVATGAGEKVGAEGGFLVGTDESNALMQRAFEASPIISKCTPLTISAGSNALALKAIDDPSRATGSRFGGVQGYWLDEAGTKLATKPKFRLVNFKLKKMAGLFYATDELLEDTAALESVARQAFAAEFDFMVADAIINGTGAGEPLGILASAATVVVTKETGQAADTIVVENIVKMWSRLRAPNQTAAVWLVNQDTFPELYTMGITVGTGGSPIFMPPGGISGQPYSTLFGRPIIPTEHNSTLGDKGDIILCDLSEYILATKGGIQSASSIHVNFIYDETVFRFVYRVDGRPWWDTVLAPYKGGTKTQSPFVTLAERA